MNMLQDPSKRATIPSLLNPTQAPSSFPHHVQALGPQSSHVHAEHTPGQYPTHAGPFPLKTANWNESTQEQSRKSTSISPSRQYLEHQPGPHMPAPSSMAQAYDNSIQHQSRMSVKQRPEDYNNASWTPHAQQPSSNMSNMPYGSPVLPPIYSAERTAIPNDLSSQSSYSSSYNEQNRPHENPHSAWQNTERVSLRLAARCYTPEAPSTLNSGDRYPTLQYYPSEAPLTHQYPQQLSLPPPNEDSHSLSKSQKRAYPDGDDTQAPKSKKAKGKSKASSSTLSTSANGLSKRGYNSRKRNEAAMISAQNAEALQRAQQEETQNGANGGTVLPQKQGAASDSPKTLIPELQFARWDTCRFQGIRFFMRDSQRKLMAVSFNQHHGRPEGPHIEFPTQWNREFEPAHAKRVKLSIAKALLPTLQTERLHLGLSDVVRRQREVDVRATCDTCMTSLFSSSWMCRVCGREVCQDCFRLVQELTIEPPNSTPQQKAALANRREKHSHSNPFFLGCTKRIEHVASNFTPVTRFVSGELDKAVNEMELVVKAAEAEEQTHKSDRGTMGRADDGPTLPMGGKVLSQARADVSSQQPVQQSTAQLQQAALYHPTPVGPSDIPSGPDARWLDPNFPDPLRNPIYDNYTPAHTPAHITAIPIYRLQVIPANYYDPPQRSNTSDQSPSVPVVERCFSDLWKKGLPILVKNLRSRFKLPWTPEHFISQYGEQSCLVVECQNDTNKRVTIEQFFNEFGKYEGRTECWKLKDWPPTADFKSVYPSLYADFSTAVPVPDYVRRDGVYNLGSHFPVNAVGPDLGPKMYNSFASSQEAGSKGSTRLHMDMADALNVMLFAAPCKDGSEGYAAWDLFRAEDSDKIRKFLRQKFATPAAAARPHTNDGLQTQITLAHDPIHGQQFYLDVQLRQELWERYGVKSYRVYQRPGDGVFIPAGCAHQVANMSDCMKIAIDFVSPENIDRCEKLTKEFREQNQAKAWKEDVLQLRTMMWFAWLSCTAKEDAFKKEEALRQAGQDHNRSSNSGESHGLGIGHDLAGVRLIERRS
ncbi:hypothetical protein CVT24_007891 [Panaeolus cyanescens]|uniref:JmjC domain-containing protein n=1 Tax=Panaeolus cyanescens TaxID=181874 RepID=A0A409VZS2_9AGAR|nr:hypothetical protein CVT24_007891 [Panaeolus cyanescens]